jgi:hypothetical protein
VIRCDVDDCIAPAVNICGCGGVMGEHPLCARHLEILQTLARERLAAQLEEIARLSRIALGLAHPDPLEVLTARPRRRRRAR